MVDIKIIKSDIFDPYFFSEDGVYCVKHKWYNKTHMCLLTSYKYNRLIFHEIGTDTIIEVNINEYQDQKVIITKITTDIESVDFNDDIQVIIVRDTINRNWIAFNAEYTSINYICDLMDNNPDLYKKKFDEIKNDKECCFTVFGIGITPNEAINNLMKEINDNDRLILTKTWIKENKGRMKKDD